MRIYSRQEDTNLYLRIAKTHDIVGTEEVLVKRRKHEANLSDRVNIKVGTLDCLNSIVDIFPETKPEKYPPMREAYLSRGRAMIMNYFYFGKYSQVQRNGWPFIENGVL